MSFGAVPLGRVLIKRAGPASASAIRLSTVTFALATASAVACLWMASSAGGKKGKGSKNVVVNRIQFEVPVVLPPPKEEMQP